MSSQTADWSDPVEHFRRALAEDQFTLYCQPIEALAGPVRYPIAEVLVRLREEENALMPPGDFLPVLEHYGMMPELDRWVLRQAMRRLSKGSEMPRFSINLSAQTIADPAFPEFFADEIFSTGVPGESVLFEIDEIDAVVVPSSTARFAATIGSLGAAVMIDGFGRAADWYGSLKSPCVQFVKIHGSLTRQLLTSDMPTPKLSALLRVAAGIGVGIVAECVEDPQVLRRLKAMNVGYAQGFGVYQPQPIDAIAESQVRQAA